jgi:hypothetical protein
LTSARSKKRSPPYTRYGTPAENSACSMTRDCALDRYSTAMSARAHAFGDQPADLLEQPLRFLAVGHGLVDTDRLALAGVGPELLAQAARVVT